MQCHRGFSPLLSSCVLTNNNKRNQEKAICHLKLLDRPSIRITKTTNRYPAIDDTSQENSFYGNILIPFFLKETGVEVCFVVRFSSESVAPWNFGQNSPCHRFDHGACRLAKRMSFVQMTRHHSGIALSPQVCLCPTYVQYGQWEHRFNKPLAMKQGWTRTESDIFRNALLKFGIGNWRDITEGGCLPVSCELSPHSDMHPH